MYGRLTFHVPLLTPSYRKTWYDKKANIESIDRAISKFNWTSAFHWKKTKLLTETLMNIFNNFIPNKLPTA